MNLVDELSAMPGVFAAGEYAYRGDRYSYTGQLDEEQARMASIMCRATTMGIHMQAGILGQFSGGNGLSHPRGWVVRGPGYTVCVWANVFCFLDNSSARLNEVMRVMRERLADAVEDLV